MSTAPQPHIAGHPGMAPKPLSAQPLLKAGERMSQVEFHRRYAKMPKHVKAELLEGVVYMASPISCDHHSIQDGLLHTWLGTYMAATPGLAMYPNGSFILNHESECQPDVVLCVQPEHGGSSHLKGGYLRGAPEFVAEVAASSKDRDLGPKKRIYGRQGVAEYLVWDVEGRVIHWYVLRNGQYELLGASATGIVKSDVFPGLWLDVPAMLRLDIAKVLKQLQRGLATKAHKSFVAKLARR